MLTPQGVLVTYQNGLFVPRRSKFDSADKDPKFEGQLVFSTAVQGAAEYKALKASIAECAREKFGDKMKDRAFVARLKLPIKEYFKGEEGDVILKANTTQAPEVLRGDNTPITVRGDVWSGQLARFIVSPSAYDIENGLSVGVKLYLNGVQITKAKMPRLDGRLPANKVFSVIEDEAGDSTAGDDDDDLPF